MDEADGLLVAVAVNGRLIHSLADGLAEVVNDGGEQLEVVVVFKRGIGNDDEAADHVAVHRQLPEVNVELVERVGHFGPDGLRRAVL